MEFLAAHTDPKHERYAEFAEWMEPDTFDPTTLTSRRSLLRFRLSPNDG